MLIDITTSLELGLITGCIALGVYTTFRLTNFTDLTCDGSVIIGAATTAALVKMGLPIVLSVFAAFFMGALAGLCTSMLHVYCRIPQIIAGILTAYLSYSISLHIMGGAPNVPLCGADLLINTNTLHFLIPFVIILCLLYAYFFSTKLGVQIQIAGYSPALAEQFGSNVARLTLIGTSISNAIIALGGSLYVHYQEFADISQGFGSLIIGIGSSIIGEKIMPKRPFIMPILGCFLGAITYQIFINVALQSTWLGLEPYDMNIIVVVCMVLIMIKRRPA